MAMRPARGRARPATAMVLFSRLIRFPMEVITAASITIRAIFTNSVGWKLKGPIPSHRFFPLASVPTMLTAIIST